MAIVLTASTIKLTPMRGRWGLGGGHHDLRQCRQGEEPGIPFSSPMPFRGEDQEKAFPGLDAWEDH